MSLLQRLESAQQATSTQGAGEPPGAGTPARVPPPSDPRLAQVAARGDRLRDIRLRLVDEVVGASDTLFDANAATDVHA
ncbi:MAG: hypothetical protein MUF10_20550, partial [Thermoanaerobaculaceae bacterium]|nr:hypothetical protein [Thermoanaerobaculaceae bacterium]